VKQKQPCHDHVDDFDDDEEVDDGRRAHTILFFKQDFEPF
jgi:hypothetical protein